MSLLAVTLAVLPETIVLYIRTVALVLAMSTPPPLVLAVLPVMVQLMISTLQGAAAEPKALMAPPLPPLLPENVQLTITVSEFSRP